MAASMDSHDDNEAILQENLKEPKVRKRKKEIFRKVRDQMEFYFSDSNLQKDVFLSNLIHQSEEGYVELSQFMNFNKVKELTSSIIEIAQAMRGSQMLQVSDDGLKIKRTSSFQPLPYVEERTIYVENIPSNVDHEWFKDVFKSFGKVVYVNLPKYTNPNGSPGQLKGYAFVEFVDVEAAESAVKYYSIPTHADLYNFPVKNEAATKAENKDDKKMERETVSVESGEEKDESETAISSKRGIKREIVDDESKEETRSKKSKVEENETEVSQDGKPLENKDKNAAKKHRKRKKKHKEKYEVETLHLRVMSKLVWNRFRDKYLHLQKEHMAKVKKSLKSWQQNYQESKDQDIKCPATDPEFTPGVIIRLNLSQAVEGSSLKEVKTKLKEIPNVNYIDIKEGRPCVYIRCKDAVGANNVLSTVEKEGEADILKDEDEKEYWKQIVVDRATKLNSQTRKKVRGSEKIMAKVEGIPVTGKGNCHIRFDD